MTSRKLLRNGFERAYLFLIFLYLYAPIFFLMVFSFNNSKSRTVWAGFTTRWYTELFSDSVIMHSLYVTLAVALISAVVASIIGTMAAFGLSSMPKGKKRAITFLNNVPMMNPDIITGVSLMLLFITAGRLFTAFADFLVARGLIASAPAAFQLSFVTLLLAHITFNIPYVILSVMPKIRQLDPHLYEAALDLGAKPRAAFHKVILPQILPGVVTGFIMAFTLSIDDFAVSYFTAGTKSQTLAMTIFSMTRRRVSPKINALSTIMFVSVMLLLIVVNVRQVRDQKKQAARSRIASNE